MKKGIIFILLAFVFTFKNNAQVFLKLTGDTLKAYTYAGGDEFNQAAVNENDWNLTQWPKTNMAQMFAYDARNTTIENGVAVFALKAKDSTYIINATEVDSNFIKRQKINLVDHQYRLKYTAGCVVSKQKYHYGLYELRFKVEKGKGVWPAFWFFGGNKNEEIDIFELKCEKGDQVHVDTHCPYGCDRGYKNKLGFNSNWGAWMPVGNYLYDGFNIIMLDWKPGELTWYINGYPLAYFKGEFPNPMNLWINTQVASSYSAFQPGPDESTTLPNNFYVDYIRVWNKSEAAGLPVLKMSKDAGVSNRFISDYKNKALRQRGLMYVKKKFNAEQGMISLTLLPANKLIVNVLGDLNDNSANLTLKGLYGTYTLAEIGKENELIIDARENELELLVQSGKKQFSQKIILSR